jgi:DNA-binding transcriptional LysR family regulator
LRKARGHDRLTTTDYAADTVLWPKLVKILRQYPDIKVEIVIESGLTDIVAERFGAGVRAGEQVAKDMIAVRIGAGHPHGGCRRAISYAAVAALFVHKAALDTPSPPEAIAKAYKLTPMELRVLLAIVEVGGVPEVATALGIAESTVRTHLNQAYNKTGANRQADLVKLVAGFSNPLLN